MSDSGSIVACGKNTCGQLGLGSVSQDAVSQFTLVEFDEEEKCVSIAAGKDFTVCCTASGDVYSWGSPESGQLGNGTEGKSIEKAGRYTFAYRTSPGKVKGVRKFDENCGIVEVACGMNHTMVMDAEGRLYTWGFGGYGRLGHGDATDRLEPEAVAVFCNEPPPPDPKIPVFAQRLTPKVRATRIACGGSASYAVAGEPFCSLYFWGITKKAGEATLKPTIYEELQGCRIVDVACGMSSSIVVTDDHTVATWGPSPTYGELGYGDNAPKSSTKVKEVESLRGAQFKPKCLAAGHAGFFISVANDIDANKQVIENAPMLDLKKSSSATAAGKKREAATSSKTTADKKTKRSG